MEHNVNGMVPVNWFFHKLNSMRCVKFPNVDGSIDHFLLHFRMSNFRSFHERSNALKWPSSNTYSYPTFAQPFAQAHCNTLKLPFFVAAVMSIDHARRRRNVHGMQAWNIRFVNTIIILTFWHSTSKLDLKWWWLLLLLLAGAVSLIRVMVNAKWYGVINVGQFVQSSIDSAPTTAIHSSFDISATNNKPSSTDDDAPLLETFPAQSQLFRIALFNVGSIKQRDPYQSITRLFNLQRRSVFVRPKRKTEYVS